MVIPECLYAPSLPFLNDLLKTEPLTALDLLVVFALSTLGVRRDPLGPRGAPGRPLAATAKERTGCPMTRRIPLAPQFSG